MKLHLDTNTKGKFTNHCVAY